MVRASDCGPEGRRFDPDIPPHNLIKNEVTKTPFLFKDILSLLQEER